MNMSFENQVALVTGAAMGMGLATAKAFAEAGAAVALADINEDAVRSAAKELVSSGHQAIAVKCNVAEHGVIGLTKSAAVEYAARGIRINAVCPGSIETPMVTDMIEKGWITMDNMVGNLPIQRIGQAEEIASAVLWLCSPGASFVIGHALVVDGGFTAQ